MAKLKDKSIVLDLKEGKEILDGVHYAYVGVLVGGKTIKITPAPSNTAIDASGDPVVQDKLLDLPHRVYYTRLLGIYRVDITAHDGKELVEYIGEGDYNVEVVKASNTNGVPLPAHLVLTRIEPEKKEVNSDEDKDEYLDTDSVIEGIDGATKIVSDTLGDIISSKCLDGIFAAIDFIKTKDNTKAEKLKIEVEALLEAKKQVLKALDTLKTETLKRSE